MKGITSIAAAAALLAASPLALAGPMDGWSGEAEFGANSSSGNSDNSSAIGKVDVSRGSGMWIHNLIGDVYKADADGVDTADRFSIGYKPKRLINDRTYLFGLLNYDEDSFANIDSRERAAIGMGHFFINDDQTLLLGEIGIGASSIDFTSGGSSDTDGLLYLHGKYRTNVMENAQFIADVTVNGGGDNTYTEGNLGFQVGIGGNLALKATYGLRRNSDIVGSRGEKDDTVTNLTLVYGIGK